MRGKGFTALEEDLVVVEDFELDILEGLWLE